MSGQIPAEVYGTLVGPINEQASQRVFANFSLAVNNSVKRVHLLVQSTGGSVGDGVGIYNFLRNLPIEIVAYNGGLVASIAVIIFLAAKVRKASETAAFVIHKSQFTPAAGTAIQLELGAKGLLIEDQRTERILKAHLKLSSKQWQVHERGNLTIPAAEALKVGLIHEIADFKPPLGSQIFNI